jgi:hypothetical protein
LELAEEYFAEERAMDYTGLIKKCVVALAGVGFFFAIIGVFGLSVSIASLAAFLALAIWIFVYSEQFTGQGR